MCINVSPTHVSQYYNTTTHELMLVVSSCYNNFTDCHHKIERLYQCGVCDIHFQLYIPSNQLYQEILGCPISVFQTNVLALRISFSLGQQMQFPEFEKRRCGRPQSERGAMHKRRRKLNSRNVLLNDRGQGVQQPVNAEEETTSC